MKKKFLISFLISLIIFGVAYGKLWHKIATAKTAIQQIEDSAEVEAVDNIVEGNIIEQKNIDELVFLLVGVDTGDLTKLKENENKSGSTGIRSDTIMVCKVNFKTGTVNILSIPRDSRVKVFGKLDKINHSHSYGGMKLLLKTVRDFTGIDIDYYVRVDYPAVKYIVDAIGGVEIDVPRRMNYHDTTKGKELHIDLQKGLQKLNGDQAMQFLRYRQYKTGDEERVAMQQYFLKEFIRQLLTPRNILKLPKLIDAYLSHVDTNIDPSIIYQGMGMATKINPEKIETKTIPGYGTMIDEISYYIVDKKGTKEAIDEWFSDYIIE
ncbi:MAG: LCP family protein [Tissierellia bacterium]|nr:LCP family protein [Tissierellia bacterium]